MSKKKRIFSKHRKFERLKQRSLLDRRQSKNRGEKAAKAVPSVPTAPMVTFSPREQQSDGQALESKPAPAVMIFQSELDYISRCILDYPDIETGGQLFGHWTSPGGLPVVEYAIGPGPRANHQPTFFNQDVEYLVRVGQTLVERYGLQHIGEWHSHHRLGLAHPSGHDAATMVNNISRKHLRRFLLCIGNCDRNGVSMLNAFTFHEDHQYHYVHAPWHVLREKVSPYRRQVDMDLGNILCHPATLHPNMGRLLLSGPQASKPVYDVNYWLNEKSNNQVLKRIIDQLPHLDPATPCDVQPKLDEHQHLHLLVTRGTQHEHIYFPAAFPYIPPEVTIKHDLVERYPGANAPDSQETSAATAAGIVWNYQGDIYRAFIDYYQQLI